MLVGTGAREFATHVGVALAEPADMISPRAQTDSAKWKERLEQASHPELNTNIARLDASALHNMQDTVGAIVSSDAGATAAGVSR
jgi:isoaspartyl peptidase/L-asparaginase-like protein (Ntn-hydrolase superfamily)